MRLFVMSCCGLVLATACSAAANPTPVVDSRPPPVPTLLSVSSRAPAEPFRANCPVTKPNGKNPPNDLSPASSAHGNDDGSLFTWLPPDGTVEFGPDRPGAIHPDGSMSIKWPWQRYFAEIAMLDITGRRIDAPAPPLRWRPGPGGDGGVGFLPTDLTFPTDGCWEVTGTAGAESLRFVVRVVGPAQNPPTAPRAGRSSDDRPTR